MKIIENNTSLSDFEIIALCNAAMGKHEAIKHYFLPSPAPRFAEWHPDPMWATTQDDEKVTVAVDGVAYINAISLTADEPFCEPNGFCVDLNG